MNEKAAAIAVMVGLAWAAIGALVGGMIGADRGRVGEGVALGLFFGPVGWIITALLRPSAENEARWLDQVAARRSNVADWGRSSDQGAEQIADVLESLEGQPTETARDRKRAEHEALEAMARRVEGCCPHCRTAVQAEPGQRVICPNCGRSVRFPMEFGRKGTKARS